MWPSRTTFGDPWANALGARATATVRLNRLRQIVVFTAGLPFLTKDRSGPRPAWAAATRGGTRGARTRSKRLMLENAQTRCQCRSVREGMPPAHIARVSERNERAHTWTRRRGSSSGPGGRSGSRASCSGSSWASPDEAAQEEHEGNRAIAVGRLQLLGDVVDAQ